MPVWKSPFSSADKYKSTEDQSPEETVTKKGGVSISKSDDTSRRSMESSLEDESEPISEPTSFGSAFKRARMNGLKTFTYKGKSYNTELKEESGKVEKRLPKMDSFLPTRMKKTVMDSIPNPEPKPKAKPEPKTAAKKISATSTVDSARMKRYSYGDK